MTEMTGRERMLAASRGQRTDKLPFFAYWLLSQQGQAERECRNRGMAFNWQRPPYVETLHGVDVREEQATVAGQVVVRKTYSTPVGSIYLDEKRDAGIGKWHGQQSWMAIGPWQTERLIKEPEDYKVLKYVVENTEFTADYFPIEQAMDWLGDDGVVMDALPHSPMQMLMIDWIGSEGLRFFHHHADYPDLVEDLYQTISRCREPMYEIAAKSPAPITLCGDNVDAFLASPKLFRKYFMPEYEKQAKVLHEHGKLMAVHMDGRVGALKDLIAETPIDIVEALHPPPMGDLPIGEALSLWKDKAIWVGFPGSVYALGSETTKQHALGLLRDLGAGDRVTVAMSTENLVSNEHILLLTSVLENAELPLTEGKIAEIEVSLA